MNTTAFIIELRISPGSGMTNRDEEQIARAKIGYFINNALSSVEGLNVASPGSGEGLSFTQAVNAYSQSTRGVATSPQLGNQPPLATITGFVDVGVAQGDPALTAAVPEVAVLCDGRYQTGRKPDVVRFLPAAHNVNPAPQIVLTGLQEIYDKVTEALSSLENVQYYWWSVTLMGHRFGYRGLHFPSYFSE